MPPKGVSRIGARTVPTANTVAPQEPESGAGGTGGDGRGGDHRTDNGTVMRLTTDELMHLAPRLRPYLHNPDPAWPDIVDAADWLRHDLGVSKSLWGDACLAMGREKAAIAHRDRLGETGGAFPIDPGRVFPRHGGEGEGRRAQSRPDDLGIAPGRNSEIARPHAAAAVMRTDRPGGCSSGVYSRANLYDGSDQNGGNRRETSAVERPPRASNPSRAALIKRLKRRREAARTDTGILLDYLLALADGDRVRGSEMSKLQGSVAPCSRKAAMCIVRPCIACTVKPERHFTRYLPRRPLPSQTVCVETGAMLRVGARHGRASRRRLSRSHHIPERQEPRSD